MSYGLPSPYNKQPVKFSSFGEAEADVTPPELIEAEVPAHGLSINLVFDESVIGFTGFTFERDGNLITIIGGGGGKDTRSFTPDTKILENEVITVSYTAGDYTDLSTNPLANFTDLPVTNLVGQGGVPDFEDPYYSYHIVLL